MRFLFIQAHARIYRITTMCRVLEVSRAGFYAWRARPLSARVRDNQALFERIHAVHRSTRQRYGSPRVYQELRALGVPCGENRVARLMRVGGLRARSARRFRVTTQSNHAYAPAANQLARDFAANTSEAAPVWMADITYLPTAEGWHYLAVVIDRASRRVVGWALRPRLDQELTCSALRMALQHQRPAGGLHHSDRGSQYASHEYRRVLKEAGFTVSMSRVGNCWDNAVVESFFATLTKELLGDRVFTSRAEAHREIFEFIEVWYNRQRRHSTLGYRTPEEIASEVRKAS
jgi:transposase InsO family protein